MTMEDNPVNPQASTPPQPEAASKPTLTYEETPIIEPIAESSHMPEPTPTPPHQPAPQNHIPGVPHAPKKRGFGRTIGNIVFFVILFGLGVWLSLQLREFLASPTEVINPETTPTETVSVPTSVPIKTASGSAVKPQGSWVTYQVVSGASKKVMSGVSYQLPPEITAPVCDGANCPSQGTNLSGSTRFTVAARGKGFTLPDFRGAILTDASGHQFVMKQSIVGGKNVYEYVGDFAGRTGGGYSFSKMRGVLVPVTDTISVEFNHFAPVGITSDFAADDVLFDKIIASFVSTVETIAPVATSTPATATSSGF